MDEVEVQGEDYEEVKDGEKREKPHYAPPDSCNHVVTITHRCNGCDPYLYFTCFHFPSLSLSLSLSIVSYILTTFTKCTYSLSGMLARTKWSIRIPPIKGDN
jgi:hypothetical protein